MALLRFNQLAGFNGGARSPPATIIGEAYGADGEHRFWADVCVEPIPFNRCLSLLYLTGSVADMDAANAIDFSGLTQTGRQRELVLIAPALLAAYEAGVSCFFGDLRALQQARHGHQVAFAKNPPRVSLRRLAEWLLNNPARAHLVPPGLADFVTPPPVVPDAEAPRALPRAAPPKFGLTAARALLQTAKTEGKLVNPSATAVIRYLTPSFAKVTRANGREAHKAVWPSSKPGPKSRTAQQSESLLISTTAELRRRRK